MRYSAMIALVALVAIQATPVSAQSGGEMNRDESTSALATEYPDLYALLLRIEKGQGLMYGAALAEGEAVRASDDLMPTYEFEFDMFDRLLFLYESEGTGEEVAEEAAAGYEVFGELGAEVLARAGQFHRDILNVYIDPTITDRAAAVDRVVDRYLSRPESALPAQPKNMDILYDHPYAWAFRTAYADLGGVVWAGHWLGLAALDVLSLREDEAERATAMDTIQSRFFAKLSYGEPPEFFPTELPLVPPIAPDLRFRHPRAAVILDNFHMLEDVLADILVAADVEDVRAALDEAIEQFLDPEYRVTTELDWTLMALQHSIFNQGGPALGVMTQDERNEGGHAQHFSGGGTQIILPGMPGE